jgi:hypothetical protein
MKWKYISTGTHANTMLGQRVTESFLDPPSKMGYHKAYIKRKKDEKS